MVTIEKGFYLNHNQDAKLLAALVYNPETKKVDFIINSNKAEPVLGTQDYIDLFKSYVNYLEKTLN